MTSERLARSVAVVTMSATKSCRAASQPASCDLLRSGYITFQRAITETSAPSMTASKTIRASVATAVMIALSSPSAARLIVLATHMIVAMPQATNNTTPTTLRGAKRGRCPLCETLR